jgi:hypothetical protein
MQQRGHSVRLATSSHSKHRLTAAGCLAQTRDPAGPLLPPHDSVADGTGSAVSCWHCQPAGGLRLTAQRSPALSHPCPARGFDFSPACPLLHAAAATWRPPGTTLSPACRAHLRYRTVPPVRRPRPALGPRHHAVAASLHEPLQRVLAQRLRPHGGGGLQQGATAAGR